MSPNDSKSNEVGQSSLTHNYFLNIKSEKDAWFTVSISEVNATLHLFLQLIEDCLKLHGELFMGL